MDRKKDSNLIIYDMEQFILKYTRFMSKDIYISLKMYEFFFKQYDYLYEILEKESLLYSNHLMYQKVINFKKNKKQFIKAHNVKYLKRRSLEYKDFFDSLYSKDVMDATKRNVVLCMEEEMLFINAKNHVPLIITKLKYLVDILKYSPQKIMVWVSFEDEFLELKRELKEKGLEEVHLVDGSVFLNQLLREEETLLEEGIQYSILKEYFLYHLFPNKKKFTQFYQLFGSYLYLNKDYKDFDTFRDYHNYMYKRKFLATGLSLKKYMEEEIKKRRNYLRTICSEVMNTKIEVDIANFLYLNSIPYCYHKENSCFELKNEEQKFIFYCRKGKETRKEGVEESDFYLYEYDMFGKKALEVLIYELIKRRYPMEKRMEEEVYEQLKNTSQDGYFRDFIMNDLLSMIQYYEENGNFLNTKLSKEQVRVLEEVILYYEQQVQKFHLVPKKVLYKRASTKIEQNRYQYVVLLGEEQLKISSPHLRILENYKEIPFVQDQVKLSLECRKYLMEHKVLVPFHSFINMQECFLLSSEFLKIHLNEINHGLSMNTKTISIYFYSDENRLLIPKEISKLSNWLVHSRKREDILIGVHKRSDVNLLIGFSKISKLEDHTLLFDEKKKVEYEELEQLKVPREVILLPYLISDSYHENLLDQYSDYHLKMTLLTLLGKCKKELCICCPISKKESIEKLLAAVQNVKYNEDVV